MDYIDVETLSVANLKRLVKLYGYTPQEGDDALFELAIQRTRFFVMSWCNITSIPRELIPEMLNMAIGEFLYTKGITGDLNDGGIDFDQAISSITLGDTNVSFSSSSGSTFDTFLNLTNTMRKGNKGILEHFRRLHW